MDDLEKVARERKCARDLDDLGKRLKWARTKLGLMQKDLCIDAQVPFSTYFGREEGVGTTNQWEILVLSITLTRGWQEKYKDGPFPEYSGKPVQKIDPMWLYYGGDPFQDDYEGQLQEYRERMHEKEVQHAQEIMDLKSQLSLFADNELKK